MVRSLVSDHVVGNISQQLQHPSHKTPAKYAFASLSDWQDRVLDLVSHHLNSSALAAIAWEKQIGFLYLLGEAIKVLGLRLTSYMPMMFRVILAVVENSQQIRSELVYTKSASIKDNISEEIDCIEIEESEERELEDVDNGTDKDIKSFSATVRVRSLCLLRVLGVRTTLVNLIRLKNSHFLDVIGTFNDELDFAIYMTPFFSCTSQLLALLPSTVSGSASRPPVLLRILHQLTQFEKTVAVVAEREDVVKIIISCVSGNKMAADTIRLVIESLLALLEFQSGLHLRKHMKVWSIFY